MDVTAFPSYKVLDREFGDRWSFVLLPILLDTSGIDSRSDLELDLIDTLVSELVHEISKHRLPEFVIYTGPEKDDISRLAFLSTIVGHRAERLVQAAELTATSLAALVEGSLQASAVSARALLELGVVCWDTHTRVLDSWRRVHGSQSRIRAESKNGKEGVYGLLWETRMGTRFYGPEDGWPLAKSIMTRLDRLVKQVPDVREYYDMLCDATHPNMEAQALHWRTDYAAFGTDRAIRFDPGRSNSRVKLYIVESIRLSLLLILPFTRDLWWIAADTANACDITANASTEPLGLPARTGRNDPCSCGSGSVTRICTHPEPIPLR